jgi:hypothetical protein
VQEFIQLNSDRKEYTNCKPAVLFCTIAKDNHSRLPVNHQTKRY